MLSKGQLQASILHVSPWTERPAGARRAECERSQLALFVFQAVSSRDSCSEGEAAVAMCNDHSSSETVGEDCNLAVQAQDHSKVSSGPSLESLYEDHDWSTVNFKPGR